MSERFANATVGEVVAIDFRAADVFERFGIDFCCGGRRSFDEACHQAAADPAAVMRELDALPSTTDEEDVSEWPLDRLIDHIVSRYHTDVRSALLTITRYLTTLEGVHGQRHPELARVRMYFEQLGQDLLQHLVIEEQVLFPYVRDLAGHPHDRSVVSNSPFGTVENPIRMMERDHREAAEALHLIRELTQEYTTPPDGCTTYAACMAALDRFERDLHRHVHLENNLLFPKAVELERGVWQA